VPAWRAQGLRPIQHWLPDLRDLKVKADLLRQGALLGKHPEKAEIDTRIAQTADTTGRKARRHLNCGAWPS
jgi:hypothetical protein